MLVGCVQKTFHARIAWDGSHALRQRFRHDFGEKPQAGMIRRQGQIGVLNRKQHPEQIPDPVGGDYGAIRAFTSLRNRQRDSEPLPVVVFERSPDADVIKQVLGELRQNEARFAGSAGGNRSDSSWLSRWAFRIARCTSRATSRRYLSPLLGGPSGLKCCSFMDCRRISVFMLLKNLQFPSDVPIGLLRAR